LVKDDGSGVAALEPLLPGGNTWETISHRRQAIGEFTESARRNHTPVLWECKLLGTEKGRVARPFLLVIVS
jgi:hypothetical protein